MEGGEPYSTIRELLPEGLIGSTVIDVTQHDEEYFKKTGRSFVELMFSTGDTMRMYVTQGFAFNPTEETEEEMFGGQGESPEEV